MHVIRGKSKYVNLTWQNAGARGGVPNFKEDFPGTVIFRTRPYTGGGVAQVKS